MGNNNANTKNLLLSILSLSLLLCAGSSTAIAVYYTRSLTNELPSVTIHLDGDVLYVGGSGPNNYTKIQDAINNASHGDTVFVYDDSSPYYENVVINRTISLIGENKDTTVIDGSEVDNVISIFADGVKISGFTIQNSKNDWQYAGIKIVHANDTALSGNTVRNNGGQGIYLHGPDVSDITISRNIIKNNSYGIYMEWSSGNIVFENTITNNENGIYVVESSGNIISCNSFLNMELGIHLYESYNNGISENTIVNNDNGVFLSKSYDNSIAKNIVRDNGWFGIWLSGSEKNTIVENTITYNIDIGVYLDYSSNNDITNNTITSNDDGIYVEFSSQNKIWNNNFRNYKLNAYFVAKNRSHCKNSWSRNYWDRSRLFPYPIFGKIKFEKRSLSWVNFDWRPLVQPYEPLSSAILDLNGNTLYVGGDGPGNYSSIQEAIDDASDGDTIFVYNGTYCENVVIDKSICLLGEDKENTIIEGNGTKDIVAIFADQVNIRNFTIRNGHFGILIQNSSDHIIDGNNIINNLHGISLQPLCNSVTICRNTFTNNVYSIRLYSSSLIEISYNNFKSYKLHAFFVGTSIAHCKNSWSRNYWDKTKLLPQPIFGKIMLKNMSFPWVNFDWHPLLKPYE